MPTSYNNCINIPDFCGGAWMSDVERARFLDKFYVSIIILELRGLRSILYI